MSAIRRSGFSLCLCIHVVFAWTYILGAGQMREKIWSEAVKHGAARYVANQETGKAEFKWNDEE